MKKFLLSALALVAVAALAITGTIAYLQWDDSDVNVMTLGNVKIEQHEYERVVDENGNFVMGVEGEDFEADYGITESYKLQPFTPDKPAYPAVYQKGEVIWDDFQQLWNQVDAPGSNDIFDDSVKNVVDKFVFVKNTGKSDCYYRTFVAIECPEGLSDGVIHTNFNANSRFEKNRLGFFKDDKGVQYLVYEMLYTEVLKPGEVSRPSLLQVFLDPNTTNEDCALFGDTWEIIAISQACQTAGFEGAADAVSTLSTKSISDAEIALDTCFGDPVAMNEDDVANVAAWVIKATAPAVDTWDGTVDTSWYNDTDTEFVIMTAEQLAGFSKLVDDGKTFEGKTVKLGKDLDLYCPVEGDEDPLSFNPIGYGYDIVFKGTFDGQAHTVANLYQNGWALGYDYSTEGGGLFASVVDATLKNFTIDNAEVVMECIDMGIVVGYSYGNTNYENILVKNSTIGNYERYTGGVVGEVNGTQTFKNVDVIDTVIASMWGDFDSSLGGIIGGKWGDAQLTFVDCDVDCRLDAYNDATSANLWFAYRRAGMLIGNSEETKVVDGTTVATADYLTCVNCTVTYREWAKYTYCEFSAMAYPYVRVQGGYRQSDYSNPRYGHPTDANGNAVVDAVHAHNDGEDHHVELTLDQLFGGGRGVYGTATHEGVTVIYNY